MATQHLGHLAADREHRVERAHRILEDHGHARAADLARLRFAQRAADRCRRGSIASAVTLPGGSGTRRMIDSAVTLLPLPLSPTSPSDLALLEVEGHAVDRAHRAAVGGEPGLQVADAEQGMARLSSADGAPRAPGARVERIAQPVAHEVDAEHAEHDGRRSAPGTSTARRPGSAGPRSCRGPSSGCGGCVPKPRKLSDASATTAAEKTMVSCTTIGDMTLRRRWDSTMRPGPAPSARAAVDIDVLAHRQRAAAHHARQHGRLHQPERQHDVLDVRPQQADQRHGQQQGREVRKASTSRIRRLSTLPPK